VSSRRSIHANLGKPAAVALILGLSLGLVPILVSGCSADGKERTQKLEVTATAYNSVRSQTNAHSTLAAWGDRLEPGMKAIAVSRDLIPLGLTHETEVEIEGLEGVYVVRDKMAKRWTKKIDIYMGTDVEAARRFGKQTLTIHWSPPNETVAY
jgi:3D (Asp-Asp-Asp) domain-containing protein